ncbi:MAG TPA: cytochrome c biogenesis protein CcsA [Tepidisphaeraceae bacterium]|nr:cytochrome c biogenesis protein CcsA [Tepidisphaeraceae bacterium]
MNSTVTKFLKPLASLRLTVALLVISCVLVFAGTTAQREMGIQDVQRTFFHTHVWAKIYLHYFLPSPKDGQPFHGGAWFPLPAGYTLIGLLLLNLLAAHAVRFKLRLKRTGVILIHLGLILLLTGEVVTSVFAVEGQMPIDVGGQINYAQDIREGHAELAFVDHSPADHDNVAVVEQPAMERSVKGTLIHDSALPIDVKVLKWYDNARVRGPVERGGEIDRLADRGSARDLGLTPLPRFTGTEAENVDLPAAFVTLTQGGQTMGTYLVSAELDRPQQVTVGGKTYDLTLRFERYYKPYTIVLKKFTHDVFPGTEVARNFASEIRLIDPSRHVDRQVKIWMNHPLRYEGETFYQQSFANNDHTSILQVVHNPGWLMPYIACAIGALGLVIHFGINLIGFLRKRRAAAQAPAVRIQEKPAKAGDSRRYSKSEPVRNYTLAPEPRWPGLVLPTVLLAIFAIFIVGKLFSSISPDSISIGCHWDEFGKLPISFEGRVQPLASVARNSLKIISSHETLKDDKGNEVPPEQWLLDVMTKTGKWAQYKAIEINHPQIKDVLGLPEKERFFSWYDIFKDQENARKLDEQARLASQVPAKQRDSYQNGMIDLHQHLGVYLRLFQVDAIATQFDLMSHPEVVRTMYQHVSEAIATVDPGLMAKIQSNPTADLRKAFSEALMRVDMKKLNTEQQQAVYDFIDQSERTSLLSRLGPDEDLYLAAPLDGSAKWLPLSAVVHSNSETPGPESAVSFIHIVNDYERSGGSGVDPKNLTTDQRGAIRDFNADVASYQSKLEAALPSAMSKVDYESFFNRFDPFLICMVVYIAIFVLAICSWVIWERPFARSAFWLLLLALSIHTFALVSRVYISGRPPVTNLYSSAVFIAWGIVVFCTFLEWIYRNGVALITASTAGFLSLLVAAGLASTEGDTMKQLQAVLDTNFWLATHVVCVTLGYTATFLTGLLAIIYIIRVVFGRSTSDQDMKDHSKMVYGVICFAMLFSFVGTILGGIWADQSWGRFWGWDPKENGAVLIVLWNALILHARWGGLVRDRGVMVLAILGNIVTSWSWFGTNMLGIGLHSYGFMQSAQFWLIAFMASQLLLAGIGMIPPRLWASFRVGGSGSAPKRPAHA